jgi:hypothetical protein
MEGESAPALDGDDNVGSDSNSHSDVSSEHGCGSSEEESSSDPEFGNVLLNEELNIQNCIACIKKSGRKLDY